MIIDRCRDTEELRNLYNNRPMPVQYDFDFLIKNPYLFCFYDEDNGDLKAYITIQKEELDGRERLTLSGASVRKNMPDNIPAIIKICNAFKDDIYAYTKLKHAVLTLKKAGFKKVKENIYKRCYNGQQQQ